MLIQTGNSFAQVTWDYGVKGGIDFANITGDDTDSLGVDTSKIGAVGGAFLTAHLNDDFAVRVEGLFVQRGAKREAGEYTGKLKLDYFEIPLLAVIKLPVTETVMIYGFAGPSIAFNLSAEVTNKGPDVPAADRERDLDDEIKGIDYGFAVGSGFEVDLGGASILFEGRWVYGLNSINDTARELDINNINYALMAGVAVPIGR